MTTQKFVTPTMVINGKTVPVSLNTWANAALTGSELTNCLAAIERQNVLFIAAEATGTTTVEPIEVELFVPQLNANITVVVGANISNANAITNDPEWAEFEARFRTDPNVTFPSDYGVEL
jgi:hypothetical protein